MVRLTVIGSSGTYPTPGNPASGHLVTEDSQSLLLDIGPGVFTALMTRGVIPDAIVLSHRHPDHCLDLIPLFNHLRFDLPDVVGIPVMAPRGLIDALAAFLGAGAEHPFHTVFDHHVVEPGSDAAVGPFRLSFGAAVHPVPALVTRVQASGRTLVYSGDTGPGGDLVTMASGADVLLCEATEQGEPPSDRYPFHLAAVEAGEVATTAGVAMLVVTHVAPRLDPTVSVTEASTHFDGPVRHADPGLEVDV